MVPQRLSLGVALIGLCGCWGALVHTRRAWFTGLVALTSVGFPAGAAAQTLDCAVTCPDGTQLANFGANIFEVIADGSFLWVEDRCEASCAPIVPCLWPNVPVVSKEGFACAPLSGFSTLEPDVEVDLSFGAYFDPALAAPPEEGALSGRLSVVGSAFDAFEGVTVVLAAISGDQQTLHAVVEVTVVDGGFTVDLSGKTPPGFFTLAFFIDVSGDRDCVNQTVHIITTEASSSGIAPRKELVWGALENASTNNVLCPLIQEGLP